MQRAPRTRSSTNPRNELPDRHRGNGNGQDNPSRHRPDRVPFRLLHQPTRRGHHHNSQRHLRASSADETMGQAAMGRKRAVLVGINYVGRPDELKGCLNDVARMRRCLVDRFGFDGADIRVLADADPSTPPPTGANIRLELERLVAGARAGDTLFFHYSGHGLQLPAETGEDDDTGYDECIVPCDGNLIKGPALTLMMCLYLLLALSELISWESNGG
jgi:hypothetical protein